MMPGTWLGLFVLLLAASCSTAPHDMTVNGTVNSCLSTAFPRHRHSRMASPGATTTALTTFR